MSVSILHTTLTEDRPRANPQPSKTIITGLAIGTLFFAFNPFVSHNKPQGIHIEAAAIGTGVLVALYRDPMYRAGRRAATIVNTCCKRLAE